MTNVQRMNMGSGSISYFNANVERQTDTSNVSCIEHTYTNIYEYTCFMVNYFAAIYIFA